MKEYTMRRRHVGRCHEARHESFLDTELGEWALAIVGVSGILAIPWLISWIANALM